MVNSKCSYFKNNVSENYALNMKILKLWGNIISHKVYLAATALI